MTNETVDTISAHGGHAGTLLSAGIILYTLLSGCCVLWKTTVNPRTDDAEIFANFIGIAPVVNGPIMNLQVVDNQPIKEGEVLLEIDDRPYRYALEQAKSDLGSLNGQIGNQSRTIASLVSGVDVAKSAALNSEAGVNRASALVDQAKADVSDAKAAVDKADAEKAYAANNLNRIEPLLQRQFVTVDQVDQARTAFDTRSQAAKQARSQLELAGAGLVAAEAQYQQAQATVTQSQHQVLQASHSVTTLDPLLGQLSGKRAAIDTAQYNLDHCTVLAPFDARVTNLTISQGAYAHAGEQIFTLIDTRVWWAIANFRETQIQHIRPGMEAEVYVLSRPNLRFKGVVDSVGFGVKPDADLIGKLAPGLPDVQRTLNWVHLASRFPVRVRLQSSQQEYFRLGESAVVVIRGENSASDKKQP
jgi:multidrug efflux system membrane fusion protein